MRGLLRNNLYTTQSSLKTAILINLAVAICMVIGELRFGNVGMILNMALGAMGTMFVTLPAESLKKDAIAKWNRFEVTMPVTKKDIMTARYLSVAIYAIIGQLCLLTTVGLVMMAGAELNMERIAYGMVLAVVVQVVTPALMYPAIIAFGEEKVDVIMMTTMLASIALLVGASVVVGPLLPQKEMSNVIFRIGTIVVSILGLIVSYFVSLSMYQKKEL